MSSLPAAGTWVIDQSHSTIEFVVRHMMVSKVKGRFGDFTGTITIGENHEASAVEANIKVASIDTRDEKRDEHLRGADFFDTDNNKEIAFKSTSIVADGDDFKVTGDLTIKDVTKPVTLDLEYNGSGTNPWGQQVIAFSATTKIKRSEFGLEWNAALETGGVLVGDDITINLEVEATPASA